MNGRYIAKLTVGFNSPDELAVIQDVFRMAHAALHAVTNDSDAKCSLEILLNVGTKPLLVMDNAWDLLRWKEPA